MFGRVSGLPIAVVNLGMSPVHQRVRNRLGCGTDAMEVTETIHGFREAGQLEQAFDEAVEVLLSNTHGTHGNKLDVFHGCGPTTHRAALTDNASRDNLLSEPTAHREDW
jgi:hypothetical protein